MSLGVCEPRWQAGSYKRVKGRSHTVERRKAIHPQKPHAISQPSPQVHVQLLQRTASHGMHACNIPRSCMVSHMHIHLYIHYMRSSWCVCCNFWEYRTCTFRSLSPSPCIHREYLCVGWLVHRFVVLFVGCLVVAWWLVVLTVPLFCRSWR